LNNETSLSCQLLESEIILESLKNEIEKEKTVNSYLKSDLSNKINERLNLNLNDKDPKYNVRINSYPDSIVVLTSYFGLSYRQLNGIKRIMGFNDYFVDKTAEGLRIKYFNRKEVLEEVGSHE